MAAKTYRLLHAILATAVEEDKILPRNPCRVRGAGTVRVRAAFTQRRSNGSAIVLGPPKSRAARQVVGIPRSVIPALQQHMSEFVGPEPGLLVFSGGQ